MRKTLRIISVVGAFLGIGLAMAQDAKPLARHPGDVIKYEIKFDGPNADKITNVNGSLGINAAVPKYQSGFTGGISGASRSIAPKTFELSFTIPNNIADGDYILSFSATANEGSSEYTNGNEFTVPPVHIENARKFTPPAVSVNPLP
jgi:hypothetical protein